MYVYIYIYTHVYSCDVFGNAVLKQILVLQVTILLTLILHIFFKKKIIVLDNRQGALKNCLIGSQRIK